MYLADTENHVVRRVGNDGNIETLAGTGVDGYGGDGGAALVAQLSRPEGVSIGKDGSVLVADTGNDAVRIIAPDGTIGTLMGGPSATGDGFAPASQVRLAGPKAVCAAGDDDRSILVADSDHQRVRRLSSPWMGYAYGDPIEIPSEDLSQVFVFDTFGQHLSTRTARGELEQIFEYDASHQLVSAQDGSGNLLLLVERDSEGDVAALSGRNLLRMEMRLATRIRVRDALVTWCSRNFSLVSPLRRRVRLRACYDRDAAIECSDWSREVFVQ
ncbi:MAG: hypothetical protein HYV07_16400 [Deltaproteobacteria bacterium]|nr:hypothetical protein [Deltaproteobacteria bacterium]